MTRPTIEELEARVREALREGRYRDSLSGLTDHTDEWWHERQAALTDLAARAREAEEIVAAAELLTRRDTFDMRIVKVREDNLIELLGRRSTP